MCASSEPLVRHPFARVAGRRGKVRGNETIQPLRDCWQQSEGIDQSKTGIQNRSIPAVFKSVNRLRVEAPLRRTSGRTRPWRLRLPRSPRNSRGQFVDPFAAPGTCRERYAEQLLRATGRRRNRQLKSPRGIDKSEISMGGAILRGRCFSWSSRVCWRRRNDRGFVHWQAASAAMRCETQASNV